MLASRTKGQGQQTAFVSNCSWGGGRLSTLASTVGRAGGGPGAGPPVTSATGAALLLASGNLWG